MVNQLSFFYFLDEYETPTFSRDQIQDGVTGWIVEVIKYVNGYDEEQSPYAQIRCRARKVMLSAHGDHYWWQTVDNGHFYMGGTHWDYRTIFAKPPTYRDIQRCARMQLASDSRASSVPLTVTRLRDHGENIMGVEIWE